MRNRNAVGTFYKLFFLAAVFFAVFVLAQLGDNFWAVGAAGIVLLIAGYLFLTQNAKQKQDEKEQDRLELDRKLNELLIAQRAIYAITKRGNEKKKIPLTGYEDAETKELLVKLISLQERTLSENRKLAEIQVNALKTVAKYNKENARQLAKGMIENTDRIAAQLKAEAADQKAGIADLQEIVSVSAERAASALREIYQDMAANAAAASEDGAEATEETEPDFVQDYEEVFAPEMEAGGALPPETHYESDPVSDSTPFSEPILQKSEKEKKEDNIASLFAPSKRGNWSATKSIFVSDVDSEPDSEPVFSSKSEQDSELSFLSEPELDSEAVSLQELESNSEPVSPSKLEPDYEPVSLSESESPELDFEPVFPSELELDSELESDFEPVSPPELESDSEPVSPSEPESDSEAVSTSEPESDSEPVFPSEPEPESDSGPAFPSEPEQDSEPVSFLEPKWDLEPVSPSEPEQDSEPVSFLEPKWDLEPVSLSEPESDSEQIPLSESDMDQSLLPDTESIFPSIPDPEPISNLASEPVEALSQDDMEELLESLTKQ